MKRASISFYAAILVLNALSVSSVGIWQQCDGKGFQRQNCDEGLKCVFKNDWYSQCNRDESLSTYPEWTKCGGKDFESKKCDPGLECVYIDVWNSQCRRSSSPQPASNPPPSVHQPPPSVSSPPPSESQPPPSVQQQNENTQSNPSLPTKPIIMPQAENVQTPPPPPPPLKTTQPQAENVQTPPPPPPPQIVSNDPMYASIAPPDGIDTKDVQVSGSEPGVLARKLAFNDGAGSDKNMQALIHAAASAETSFGTKGLNDAMDSTKKGTAAENFSPLRMNRAALASWGYSEEDMAMMSDNTDGGNELAAEAFKKGIEKLGLAGFMHLHRGGETRFNNFKEGRLSEQDKSDTLSLMKTYRSLQAYILKNDMLTKGETYAWRMGPVEI